MHIAVLSGAGISAESGLPTYRGPEGLWRGRHFADLASPEAFAAEPELVQAFYNERRQGLAGVEPNAGHHALAELEARHRVSIITQNVDDLHERAGSTTVLHLHGELVYGRSSADPACRVHLGHRAIAPDERAPDGTPLRPAVVWFGEAVERYEEAEGLIADCDQLWVVGTSLQVYPAALLATRAPEGAPVHVIDPGAPTVAADDVHYHRGPAATVLPELCART